MDQAPAVTPHQPIVIGRVKTVKANAQSTRQDSGKPSAELAGDEQHAKHGFPGPDWQASRGTAHRGRPVAAKSAWSHSSGRSPATAGAVNRPATSGRAPPATR